MAPKTLFASESVLRLTPILVPSSVTSFMSKLDSAHEYWHPSAVSPLKNVRMKSYSMLMKNWALICRLGPLKRNFQNVDVLQRIEVIQKWPELTTVLAPWMSMPDTTLTLSASSLRQSTV